jgi:hypothetical protein
MKTLFSIFLLLCAMYLSAQRHHGVKPDRTRIPEEVKTAFKKENPDAEATWKATDTSYRAQFIDQLNLAHIRVFDKRGKMIYRDDVMDSYPEAIHAHLTKNYPGEGFTLWSRIDAVGNLTYYTYRNSDTLWFNKDGIFVSPKKKIRGDSIIVIMPPTN